MKCTRSTKYAKVGLQKVQLERIISIKSNHIRRLRFPDGTRWENAVSQIVLRYSNTGPRKNEMPKEWTPERLIRGSHPQHNPFSPKSSEQLPIERANAAGPSRPGGRGAWAAAEGKTLPEEEEPAPGPGSGQRERVSLRGAEAAAAAGTHLSISPCPTRKPMLSSLVVQRPFSCKTQGAATALPPPLPGAHTHTPPPLQGRPRPHSPLRPARQRGTAPPPSRCAAAGRAPRPPSPRRSGAHPCRRLALTPRPAPGPRRRAAPPLPAPVSL